MHLSNVEKCDCPLAYIADCISAARPQTLKRVFTIEYAYPPFLIALGMSVVGLLAGAALEWLARAVFRRPHSGADPLAGEGEVLPHGTGVTPPVNVKPLLAPSRPASYGLSSVWQASTLPMDKRGRSSAMLSLPSLVPEAVQLLLRLFVQTIRLVHVGFTLPSV